MDEGGTYLEDFLLSLEMLPNDMRRDFELVRRLHQISLTKVDLYQLNAILCFSLDEGSR